ncbi:MAG TPA: 23S rRNA (guanosine(2251)-2'-O)-methyltransferase RlmB [Candidatus Aminicenantes bacterium]|nr:23S rRNA (guanosine(2251)-2'-O)-methyltransferase RlmB [Candidatus Aminicenantes bacterium]
MIITSINALIEALRAGKAVQKVWISRNHRDPRVQQLKQWCHRREVLYRFVPREALDRRAGGVNQGVYAEIAAVETFTLQEAMDTARHGLFLLLDGVTDTGNMGALLRSAVAAGVDGVILPRRRSAPLNESVLHASAGALLQSRIVVSRKTSQDLGVFKQAGYWVFGAVAEAGSYSEADLTVPLVLVMGSESGGISPAVLRQVDQQIGIPICSGVESLNVSVAAGILLFEIMRQRTVKGSRSPVTEPPEPRF